MTEQTDAAEVEARIMCPEHGEPLAIEGRGSDGTGPYFYAWICPSCPGIRRCGSCGRAAPEAWSSGRCHGCYRTQSRRLEQERREREQADHDRAIAAAEARGAERALREAAEALNAEPDSRSCTQGTDEAVRMKRARSKPVSPGIMTSRISRSKFNPSNFARASCALIAVVTR